MGKHIVKGFKRYYLLEKLQCFHDENYEYVYIEYVDKDYENFVKQCVFMSSSMLHKENTSLPDEVLEIILRDVNYKFDNIRFKVAINQMPNVRVTGRNVIVKVDGTGVISGILDFYYWKFIYQEEGKNYNSIEQHFRSKMKAFQNRGLGKLSSRNQINFEDIAKGEKPYAIFLITPDYDTTFNFFISTFISQLYVQLVEYAEMKVTK